jgi:transposase-like protein
MKPASAFRQWHYLYRAVDKGKTVDFLLRPDRGIAAAQAFFRKALARTHVDGGRSPSMATWRVGARCGDRAESIQAGAKCKRSSIRRNAAKPDARSIFGFGHKLAHAAAMNPVLSGSHRARQLFAQ